MATTVERTTALSGRFNLLPMDAILFGPDSVKSIAGECERIGIKRVFLVVSPTLAKQVDLDALFDEATGGRVQAVYSGAQPHVPHDVVLDAARAAREAKIDGLVSVGGGSPIDLAKAVSLCLAEGLDSVEDISRYRVLFEYPDKVVVPSMTKPGVPHITVSTTLSAAEFTNIIGITDTVRMVKDLYIDQSLVPRVAVLDTTLAAYTPRSLWASTGMRAVDHAIEGLCSTTAQPVTDALSADALARLARYLPLSVADVNDVHAAGQCQIAAWQSIFGLTNVNLGLSHGVGHQLGARCAVPHGITSCVMLPTVLEYNIEQTREPQAKIAAILAEAMGVPTPTDGAASILREFIASLGLPTRLRDVGVTEADFPALAHDAMADLIVASNPRPIGGEQEVIEVLEKAY